MLRLQTAGEKLFLVTEHADRTPRALQERGFFESQQYATVVYQSELSTGCAISNALNNGMFRQKSMPKPKTL